MISDFDLVDTAARQTSTSEIDWRFFVPGRLEIFGKHTDYAGGHSLVAAVPRGFAVAAQQRDDSRVVVVDALSGRQFSCPVGATPDISARWHRYVVTVVSRLAANFPGANLSSRIALASDLPSAAGISSSSALIVAIAEALIAIGDLERSAEWRASIHRPEDRAEYFGCIENGQSFGALAGTAGVGTRGGSEDHAAIVLSRDGFLQAFSFSPLRSESLVPMPSGWTFVVVTTGVRASKTGAAMVKYNTLSELAARILEAWRERHPGDGRTLGELAAAGVLPTIELPPALAARRDHFFDEDARVLEAVQAFRRGDVEAVGALADASQREAARLLGNQVPETIDLVTLARDLGAVGASGFGAGWGGSVWALVNEADAPSFLEAWLRTYKGRYPQHMAEGFVSPPSAGVIRI